MTEPRAPRPRRPGRRGRRAARRQAAARAARSSSPAARASARAYERAAAAEPDWRRATVWWGDERCVPPDDERSNYGLARRTLLDRLDRRPSSTGSAASSPPPRRRPSTTARSRASSSTCCCSGSAPTATSPRSSRVAAARANGPRGAYERPGRTRTVRRACHDDAPDAPLGPTDRPSRLGSGKAAALARCASPARSTSSPASLLGPGRPRSTSSAIGPRPIA